MNETVINLKDLWEDKGDWGISISECLERTLFSWRDDPPRLPERHSDNGFTFRDELDTFRDAIFADSIFQKLLLSPSFVAMVDYFEGINNVPIIFETQENSAGLYRHIGEISINHNYRERFGDNPCAVLWIAAHEIRHGWHDEAEIFNSENKLGLEDIILLTRSYEADAVAFQITVCWELKEIGEGGPWDFLVKHSPYAQEASAFENTIRRNPKAALSGEAQNAAYRSWFQNRHHTRFYDTRSCRNFQYFEYKRNSVLCSFEATALINQKLSTLGSMPYIDQNGELKVRNAYLSSRHIGDLKGERYRTIHEAPTINLVKHIKGKQPKSFRLKPRNRIIS